MKLYYLFSPDCKSKTDRSKLKMSAIILQYVAFCLCFSNAFAFKNSTYRYEKELNLHILNRSNANIRPLFDHMDTVDVQVRFRLMGISGIDEQNQVLYSTVSYLVDWNCELLSWEPKLYRNITNIMVFTDTRWTPQIFVSNKLGINMDESRQRSSVFVMNDGTCKKTVAEDLHTRCIIDISKYPFDSQTCAIIVTQTFYTEKQQNLSMSRTGGGNRYMFDENPE